MISETMTFMTANGIPETDQKVDLVIDEMKDTISHFVMEESPSILSIGRSADSGYGFLPGEEPVMFDDIKSVRVKGHIPYLGTNDETEQGPLGKLTESAIGVLDYPEDRAVNMSGGLTSSPDETPIAVPAEEPGEVGEGDADERDEGGGSDEDEVEVDVEAGRGVKRKKGTLKHEAGTLEHMVTQRFANPYCDACVRAKMRHFNTKKGAFKQQLKKWGDRVTFDFLTPESQKGPDKWEWRQIPMFSLCVTYILG